jgi:peptide/nickel transport system ATP-binding protein
MLSVKHLSVSFTLYDQGLTQKQVTPITDLDLSVRAGEVVAVVGSSGSGKSLLAHAVLGILPRNAQVRGQLLFKDQRLTPQLQQQLRGKAIALIPQSVGYLDPLKSVGSQVKRAARLNGMTGAALPRAVTAVLERYDLAPHVQHLYPFQLSGGMARRVLVSTAAIGKAELLIADEPTPGLHPEIVKETLNHLRELVNEGRAVILITHDIEAALQIADQVAVFYAGTTVEIAGPQDFASNRLRHPYTQALWQSLPRNTFIPVPGSQPNPDHLPRGCLFADRCPQATEICRESRPELTSVQAGWVRCFHA